MKAVMRDRKIWMRTVRSQKVKMYNYQITCCSLQDRKCSDHSDKNRQNQSHSVLKQDMNAWDRIFCLSMQLSKRNCSACDSTLLSFCWDKTSNSRLMHRLNEHQKSHQQFKKNTQTNQMIYLAADSVTVQFDWKAAVWR